MQDPRTLMGVLFALAAYTMWGLMPIYFKQLSHLPALDILMHRVVWSALGLCLCVSLLVQWHKIRTAFRNRKVMTTLVVASLLLAVNWVLFIWAVNNDYLLESSLGYYINPLFNVLLGRVFLGERLRFAQKCAVAVAAVGVIISVAHYGQLPWIALCLACSFSIYGLLRKQVAVDSMPGLFIETLFMLPFALVYWFLYADAASNITTLPFASSLLLICAGIVTTAPLLCFTAAARRLRYSTLGFFQYIGPSLMFILAIYVYHEPISSARLITFACVWTALAIFSLDSLRHYRMERRANRAQV